MLLVLNELEKFNLKPTQNMPAIDINPPISLQVVTPGQQFININEMQTFSTLKLNIFNKMNFNKLDLEEKKLLAKL